MWCLCVVDMCPRANANHSHLGGLYSGLWHTVSIPYRHTSSTNHYSYSQPCINLSHHHISANQYPTTHIIVNHCLEHTNYILHNTSAPIAITALRLIVSGRPEIMFLYHPRYSACLYYRISREAPASPQRPLTSTA